MTFDKYSRALIFTHVNADGDALGSAAALALALGAAGVRAQIVVPGGVPIKYGFMRKYADFTEEPALPVELAIAVDTSTAERLGEYRELFFSAKHTMNFDHHITNELYAQDNLVRDLPAAGALIDTLIAAMGVELTREMAECLYIALCTDTGRFAYSGVTGDTYRLAAKLADAGADIPELCRLLFQSKPYPAMRLIERALSRLEPFYGGKLCYVCTTLADLEETGADASYCDEIINYARDIDGVELAVYQRQTAENEYKLSLRSKRTANVSDMAALFGGGGHIRAAGCRISGGELEVKARILAAAEPFLKETADE